MNNRRLLLGLLAGIVLIGLLPQFYVAFMAQPVSGGGRPCDQDPMFGACTEDELADADYDINTSGTMSVDGVIYEGGEMLSRKYIKNETDTILNIVNATDILAINESTFTDNGTHIIWD